jgi:hypothetical protein
VEQKQFWRLARVPVFPVFGCSKECLRMEF